MVEDDVQLIRRVLSGDDEAFTTLVRKYQKSVHALAWRRVDDFHFAEEITQDVFLRIYKHLPKLKDPRQFSGWVYVTTNRLCNTWLKKNKSVIKSLEDVSMVEVEESSYSHYVSEKRQEEADEYRHELVRKLLKKLPESERTVVTLYYLGEMTAKEIGNFLGVSVNTITSRLRRARERLQQDEELLVQQLLGSVQLSKGLTENIIQKVADVKLTPSSSGQPLLPWGAFSAAAVLVTLLLLGLSNQYLTRFQRPYNIDAVSETTVEIIDAPIVLDTQAKPDLRNQAGRFETTGKSSASGPQLSEPVTLGAARIEKETRPSTQQQWVQATGPEAGAMTSGLMASSKGDIYAASPVGVYRLAPDVSTWTLINTSVAIGNTTPMAERDGTLYLVSISEVLTSVDRGETWQSLGERPKGHATGLVITDEGLYFALDNQVFRSEDAGKQWTPLIDENAAGIILAIAAIENTVFVGTNQGLYRVRSGTWEKVRIETSKAIHSLTVSENNLYVGTGLDFAQLQTDDGRTAYARQIMGQIMGVNSSSLWEIFHSTDLGDSWTEITPTSWSPMEIVSPSVKIFAAGETLLAMGLLSTLRSTDGGKTWMGSDFDPDTFDLKSMIDSMTPSTFPAIAVDENTLFKSGLFGVSRSTDGGKSWHRFMKGITGTKVASLVAVKNALYTNTVTSIAKSTDGGETWETLRLERNDSTLKLSEKMIPNDLLVSPKIAISNDIFYGTAVKLESELRIFHLSANGSYLIPIPGVPPFGSDLFRADSDEKIEEFAEISDSDEKIEEFAEMAAEQADPTQQYQKQTGGFAVSGETFYVEYGRRLFRWRRGEGEWFNTGLMDTVALPDDLGTLALSDNLKTLADSMGDLALAVSGETVYVGKRDGHLFRSLDAGNTWKDLTSNLPLRFEHINEIVFAGSTVYVATDTGVLTSEAGEHWRVITDKTGVNTVIDRMAVTDTTVYGVGSGGAHLLDNRGEWEKISPEVPDDIIAATINGNRLYVATEGHGIFHISLENENN